jgi:formate hydrogenlyase subunit 6/NADH:ubiquinone oxidoreductase subunit I
VLSPFPKLKSAECVGCGKCASICPAKAIDMVRKKPRIDRSACIRCFCCQEFCPVGAMQIGRRAIVRLLGK